jgi:hypothetical protein
MCHGYKKQFFWTTASNSTHQKQTDTKKKKTKKKPILLLMPFFVCKIPKCRLREIGCLHLRLWNHRVLAFGFCCSQSRYRKQLHLILQAAEPGHRRCCQLWWHHLPLILLSLLFWFKVMKTEVAWCEEQQGRSGKSETEFVWTWPSNIWKLLVAEKGDSDAAKPSGQASGFYFIFLFI